MPKTFQNRSNRRLNRSWMSILGETSISCFALGLQPQYDLAGAGTFQNHSFLIPRRRKNNPRKHTMNKHLTNHHGPICCEHISKSSPKSTSKTSPKSFEYRPWTLLESQMVPGTPQTSKNDARDLQNDLPERQDPTKTMQM